jgi:hypothetical protein
MINFQLFTLCGPLDGLHKIQTDFKPRVMFVDAEIKHGGGYQAVLDTTLAP